MMPIKLCLIADTRGMLGSSFKTDEEKSMFLGFDILVTYIDERKTYRSFRKDVDTVQDPEELCPEKTIYRFSS